MRWDVAHALEREHGLPRSAVFETLYGNDSWRAIERGIGDPEAWRELAHRELEARAGRPLPRLHDHWRAASALIQPNVDLARGLRPAYRVSMLSNADGMLRRRLEEEHAILSLFDDIVCSAEVGLAKPDPAVYRLAADRLGVPPARCVFIDDHEPNVAAAATVGMTAVLYRVDQGHDLRAQLAELGIGVALSPDSR
jgi:putative hydrolase of the HAD superfamily